MHQEIAKANKKAKFILYLILVLVLILNTPVSRYLGDLLKVWVKNQFPGKELFIIKIIMGFVLGCYFFSWVLISGFIFRRAYTINSWQQYPYPGMIIVYDTRIVYGDAAISKSKVYLTIGILLLLIGLLQIGLLFQLFDFIRFFMT